MSNNSSRLRGFFVLMLLVISDYLLQVITENPDDIIS